MKTWSFAKGHGTMNDFVLLKDRNGMEAVTPAQVRALCDRRAGIGADGLLRVVKAEHIPEWTGDPDLWFMDYRNADGSVAEMCGNGLRVFAVFLVEEGLVAGAEAAIGTRAGLRTVQLNGGVVRASMGKTSIAAELTSIHLGDRTWPAMVVDVGNPHAVVLLEDADDLEALDLTSAPRYDREVFPAGVNVEFVRVDSERRLTIRVLERGVGETWSCGTGIVASAAAHLHASDQPDGEVHVQVRGGALRVDLDAGQAWLTGPAVIVARGEVRLPDDAG